MTPSEIKEMRNSKIPAALIALSMLAGLMAALPAAADSSENRRLELTPTLGYRSGGEFDNDFIFDLGYHLEVEDSESIGLTLGIGLNRHWTLEFLWDQQESVLVEDGFFFSDGDELFDIDVNYAHVGVTYEWTPGHLRPFVAGSLGATHFAPAPSDLSDETRFSMSLGGGLKVMFNDHFGLRLEGRLFSTFMEDGEDFYCDDDDFFDDECGFDEDFFFQSEARAGLIFAF